MIKITSRYKIENYHQKLFGESVDQWKAKFILQTLSRSMHKEYIVIMNMTIYNTY